MTNIAISVIVPVYNVEKYLAPCLDSLEEQTFQNFEIIAVNDGSTDGSLAILNDYSKKDTRFFIITTENRGLGFARNIGMLKAKGRFIFFLDSDDWIEKDTLEKLYNVAIENQADIVSCTRKRIDVQSGEVSYKKNTEELYKNTFTQDEIFHLLLSGKIHPVVCTLLIKKDLFFNNFIFFPQGYHEDVFVSPKLYFYSQKTIFVDEPFYNHRVRAGSIMNSSISWGHINGVCGSIIEIRRFLKQKNQLKKYEKSMILFYFVYFESVLSRAVGVENEEVYRKAIIETIAYLPELRIYNTILSPKERRQFENTVLLCDVLFQNEKEQVSPQNIDDKYYQRKITLLEERLSDIKNSKGYKYLLKFYDIKIKINKIFGRK